MYCKDCPFHVYIDDELRCAQWSIGVEPYGNCSVGDKYEQEEEARNRPSECSTCANRSGNYCNENHRYTRDDDYCHSYAELGSGCFIVTACIKARNLPNDCDELMTLRDYRDNYVLKMPNGKKEVSIYYAIAPKVVAAINKRSNSNEIYESIYTDLVVPCMELVKSKQYLKAYILYKGATFCLGREFLGEANLYRLLNKML